MNALSRARTHTHTRTHTISVVLFLFPPSLHRQGARAIDTASVYRNEIQIGEAIKESGIPRKIFSKGITSDFKLQYKSYCQAPRRQAITFENFCRSDLFITSKLGPSEQVHASAHRALCMHTCGCVSWLLYVCACIYVGARVHMRTHAERC